MTAFAGTRVLVTGGSGVIGRELLALLGTHGAEILSADRLPLPMPPPAGVTHLQTDLATDDLDPIWRFQPQLIFHLAATFERSEESSDFWLPNWQDNVIVSHRLAEGARSNRGVEALVFASSYLIYEPSQYLFPEPRATAVVLREDARQDPRNLCGAAKLYAEKEYAFAREHLSGAARLICARIFRVYGRGSRDIVSRWVRAALAGEALTVYQPENRFDYVHARDVAEGLMRLATCERGDGVVNIGTGRSRTVDELLVVVRAALPDREVHVTIEARKDHYEASQADTMRLRELTDWIPPTDLEEGVRDIVAWELAAT